jgi:hypothetical protein
MSPIADLGSPRRGQDITGYQVVNCRGYSTAARVLFVGHVNSAGNGAPATGAKVRNGIVVGLTGSAKDYAMEIRSDTVGSEASIGQIDRIRFSQTRLTVRNPATAIAQAVLITEATPGAIGGIDFDGLTLHDIPNPAGLKISAERAVIRATNCDLQGVQNGLLLAKFGEVHLSGKIAATGSAVGMTAPIRLWNTAVGDLHLEGAPTLSGVISDAGGIKIDGGTARVYGSHVVINKASGATNTRAATSPSTATITMDGAIGTIDLPANWGSATLGGGIASGAGGSALIRDVTVITDSDNHGYDVRGISDAVIWRAHAATRSPAWSLNAFAATTGDRVRILHDSSSAYTLRVFDLVSGLDLATISRGQWLDAEFDGEAFVLIGIGGAASSGTWMSGDEPLLRDITAGVNTGAVANRILRTSGVNTAVFKSADGPSGAWLDTFGATRYTPGHRIDGTAAGTWTASSVSGWYYLSPALTDVVQVIEGDRIPLVTGTISASDPAGRWAVGNADGLAAPTLYVKPFGGNPAALTNGLLRYRTAAEGVMLTTEARRVTWGTAPPTTGYGMLGDVHWNWTPTPGGVPGWRCTATGSPGTWTPMAVLGLTASGGSSAWGGITGTLSAQTDLQAALNAKAATASLAAVATSGSYLDLSNPPSPSRVTPTSTEWLTTTIGSVSYGSNGGLYEGGLVLFPFRPDIPWTVTEICLEITTAAASSAVKYVIYSAAANGQPGSLLLETGSLDATTTGNKIATGLNLSLSGGAVYWIGVRVSTASSLGYRGWANGTTMALPIQSPPSPSPRSSILRYMTYASAPPSSWVWSTSELSLNPAPAFLFR